jgi:hypothetical protein
MSDSIIKINPSKTTELDFEVRVQTNCADDMPCVRFAVELVEEQRWLSMVCTRDDDTKRWTVSIPPLKPIVDRPEYPFILEVLIEDYYFVPAKGVLQPIQAPAADLSQSKKPKIAVSFDADEKKKKKKKETPIEEQFSGAAGSVNGGQSSPNNNLLVPEFPPEETHIDPLDDEDSHDIGDVFPGRVTPGDTGMTADNIAQSDNKDEFNAREIAQQIVKDRVNVKKTSGKKGFLFKRVNDKAVIEGLHTAEIKEMRKSNAAKVKKILND